ncbi:MAG: right-handed parallel beta-helix repeat-containing protein [Bacteroidales bacterium]
MKKTALTITAIILMHCGSYAQTVIPGGSVSGTWTIAGSPYNVQGSIMVPDASTLTIEPGVTVNFQGQFKLLILGQILAIGTATDSITFTAADTSNGWRSIHFDGTPATNDTSKLYYCRIRYGKAKGAAPDDDGGGFHFQDFSKAIVSNCLISHCLADNAGGGIACKNSSPVISNNNIANNYAWNVGGGINCNNSNPTIIHNLIAYNSTTGNGGGGIFCLGSEPDILYNTIINNSNNPTLHSCGGGIWCNGCSPTIIGNTVSNNSSPWGGGICSSGASPSIINNTITNNTAETGGGILCYLGSTATITNNTIANNSAVMGGALYCELASSPVLRNTILWGNTASSGGQQVNLEDEGSDPDFYYCDVQGGSGAFETNSNFYTGIYQNNINSDPHFVSPSGGSGTGFNGVPADWSLQDGSACINAGDPNGSYPATDKAGNPRVANGVIDIGAFEYQWAMGINPVNTSDALLIYPNPVVDLLVVENQQKSLIEILNVNGQVLTTINNDSLLTIIHVGNLSSGVYLIKATTGDAVTFRKFVKR